MSRGRWDRRKGNPWDIDQSDDPNIAIYGEKARPLPLDGKLPTSKDVDLDTYHFPDRPKNTPKRGKNSPDNSSEASKEVDEGEHEACSVHQHLR